MPKEVISSWPVDSSFQVKVGWAPDQDVQVGVENDEYRSLNWLLYGGGELDKDKALAEVGTTVRDALRSQGEDSWDPTQAGRDVLNALDTIAVYSGVWATLDRHGCNRLIRTLRRARDSAFGRDE